MDSTVFTKPNVFRAVCLVGALIGFSFVGIAFGTDSTQQTSASPDITHSSLVNASERPFEERSPLMAPWNGTLVVSAHNAPLVAFDPGGRLLYYDNQYKSYWDVDPDPEGSRTVLYSASVDLNKDECPVAISCTRQAVLRTNLSTGSTDVLHERYRPGTLDNEWHDVDRVGDDQILIADMSFDEVRVINTTTGTVEWAWSAQSAFNISSGGSTAFSHSKGYPEDWTHMNDVEVLKNGTIMVSLRNQDQIIFLNRTTGLINKKITLGTEDDYDILYEQHNPDFIPAERGGPAVLVADSQNNRIVEYQRQDGGWNQSWVYSDAEMLWPRDADRLPSGKTLIADVHSHRVLVVGESGTATREVKLAGFALYDIELLGTGDESATGQSATALGLSSHGTGSTDGPVISDNQSLKSKLYQLIKPVVPNKILNGLLFVVPDWLGILGLLGVITILLSSVVLALGELKWRYELPEIVVQWPIKRKK